MTVRLVHLSDIHFGGEDIVAVEAAIEAVAGLAPGAVVVTGDLTLNGLPREFAAAREWLARLPQPCLVTPGNHDTPYWNLPLRALVPFDRYRRYIGPPDEVAFHGAGLAISAINTARGAQPRLNWSLGAINLAAVARAAGRMTRTGRALRVFACHHPLTEIEGAPVGSGVHRGEAAMKLLSDAGADLILTGHLHTPFARPLPHGEGRTYACGGGTLSIRTRGTPASFSVIDADDETVTVTALGWDGARFEPWRTWALPRGRQAPAAA